MEAQNKQHHAARVASLMVSWHDLTLISCVKVQSLWAGYGHIFAIEARAVNKEAEARLDDLGIGREHDTGICKLILKLIIPGKQDEASESHMRKILSYHVEQSFYNDVAPSLGQDTSVAQCLASTSAMTGKPGSEELDGLIATILTDLSLAFPVAGGKRSLLTAKLVHAAVAWLARFHSTTRGLILEDSFSYLLPPLEEMERRRVEEKPGTSLWLNGGYTYLATRHEEFARLADTATADDEYEWAAAFCQPSRGSLIVGEAAALSLTPRGRPFETLVHGDVKSENLFSSQSGERVAFFDFQYVGLGLGVCDLAKLFTCSVPMAMLVGDVSKPLQRCLSMDAAEEILLREYHAQVSDVYPWDTFLMHWQTALVDWCRFQASWGWWGNTRWLQGRVRCILADEGWRQWLTEDCAEASMDAL